MLEASSEDIKNILLETGVMETYPLQSNTFSIGTIAYGPALSEAIATGVLDPFFKNLAFLYRDIYGRADWYQYLICSDEKCRKTKMGARAETGLTILDEELNTHPEDFICHCCGALLEFFYPPEETVEEFRKGFRDKVFASLLFTQAKALVGFSLGWETTIEEGYYDKVISGKGDNTKPKTDRVIDGPPMHDAQYYEYLKEFQSILGVHSPETKTFNSAECAIVEQYRNARTCLPLVHAIYSLAQKKMATSEGEIIPVIGHTLFGSKPLAICEKIGFIAGSAQKGADTVRVYSTLPRLIQGSEK